MKKFTLIITTFLVLMASIVFSGCKDNYSKIKIECNREIIELTIQEDEDNPVGVIFEISGVKSWGKVDVDSKPSGAVSIESVEVDGKKCYVILTGVQPTDSEAELVITHLASGKQGSVPLTVGLKLEDVAYNGNNLVIDIPEKVEVEGELQDVVKEYNIAVSDVVTTTPLNYSDKIIWTTEDEVEGVSLKQYLSNGSVATNEQVFTANNEQTNIDPNHIEGISEVLKTTLEISSACANGSSITLKPISVFNSTAVKYDDVEVTISFIQVLDRGMVSITSSTHGKDANGTLGGLVLISNPYLKRDVNEAYNYYNTANIKFDVADIDVYKDLYNIELVSEVDYLLIEQLTWNEFRIVASEDSYGSGKITAKFVPNNSVGDLKSFEMSVSCTVGEQATLIKGYRGRAEINFNKTSLTDDYSTADGQRFKFEVLSTNTLDALSYYQIIIESELLYINPSNIKQEEIDGESIKYSPYIQNSDGSYFNLDDTAKYNANEYKYLISLRKDGREIIFCYNEDTNKFESELLKDNTIEAKYIDNINGDKVPSFFGIEIKTCYDKRYDVESNALGILNNKFDELSIEYQLEFTRQRKVESVSYTPLQLSNTGFGWTKTYGGNAEDEWKFYFTESMLEDGLNYYGIKVNEIKGINNSSLTNAELSEITLTLQVHSKTGNDCNIGLAKYSDEHNYQFNRTLEFTYDTALSDNNIILLGAIDSSKSVDFGDYYLEFVQDGVEVDIAERDINVYKQLSTNDISMRIPNADFEGDKYLDIVYQLITTEEEFNNIVYTQKYKKVDNEYVLSSETDVWKESTYYIKNTDIATYVLANQSTYSLRVDIEDSDYANYYEIVGSTIKVDKTLATIETLNNIYNNFEIKTPLNGLFNTVRGTQEYIKLTITIKVNKYDYFGVDSNGIYEVKQELYFYVYEPITKIAFDNPSLDKFDYNSVSSTEFEYTSHQTLKLVINNKEDNNGIRNYISSITWQKDGSGIDDTQTKVLAHDLSSEYTFVINNQNLDSITGFNIAVTVKQFGSTYTIYCPYVVRRPILTEQVVLNNSVSYFQSGTAFLNLKDDQTLEIDADNYSSDGEVSLPGFKYYICNQYGYSTDVVQVNDKGELTSLKAGKAKLIIVAKDRLKTPYSTGSLIDWCETSVGVGYLIVDILVTDGSDQNPYLIGSVEDLKSINDRPNKHYALITSINLGISLTLGSMDNPFTGSLTSYQENEISSNRFSISGIQLTKSNPNFITKLGEGGSIKDVDFYVNMNYTSTTLSTHEYVGLVGINQGSIENITVNVLGQLEVANGVNVSAYIIGVMVGQNEGAIKIDNQSLVGVQGSLNANVNNAKEIYLGGVVGNNLGTIQGAVDKIVETPGTDVEYGVFYDNQGALVDLDLTLTGNVSNTLNLQLGVGLVIGRNDAQGTMSNAYSIGSIEAPTVNNIGGLIGQNNGNGLTNVTTTTTGNTYDTLSSITMPTEGYQVTNSYSTATLQGNNNVGGAVGYDDNGSYEKVYYEIYDKNTVIRGENNVGGLIGYSKSTDLYYCYVNSFVWGYATSVDYYEIVGNRYVGGLIGQSFNEDATSFTAEHATHIVNSVASTTLQANFDVAGLIGRLKLYGGIYNAYFYGLIDSNLALRWNGVACVYNNGNEETNETNTPYNNTYAIVNGVKRIDKGNTTSDPFATDTGAEFNNGYPYIKYNSKNLITIVPKTINIANAIVKQNDTNGKYVLEGNTYVLYDESKHSNASKYPHKYLITAIYEENNNGEYVRVSGEWTEYKPSAHSGYTRYTLRTIPVNTGVDDIDSIVKNNIILAYYYQFTSLVGENAGSDMRELNTLDMHDVLNDNEIKVSPTTIKRFSLVSSDSAVVSVLANGKLLLKKEGQATITLVSTLNPNATASFVIVVRSKVLDFGLYSNANYLEQYLINNQTLSIVKNQSKIIYADYSGVVNYFNRTYNYNSATNMAVEFTITADGTLSGTIDDYISFNNGTKKSAGVYVVKHGQPITISVHEYFEGRFRITAKPYVLVDFEDSDINVQIANMFTQTFDVITRKGVSSVTPDKNRIEMMPINNVPVNIEINTDYAQSQAKIEVRGHDSNGNYEVDSKQFWEMLNIKMGGTPCALTNVIDGTGEGNITLPIDKFDKDLNLQTFSLDLSLNEKSHCIEQEFTLEVRITIDGKVGTFNIYVSPQEITSLMALNYKLDESNENPATSLEDVQISKVIRPGKRNIIVVDVAPNIAIYDYLEIEDITYIGNEALSQSDNIQFIQLTEELKAMNEMDEKTSSGLGIRLKKSNRKTSTMYVSAILPLTAQSNNTHTIKITAYDKSGKELKNITITVEAVLYPQIILDYSYPNGEAVKSVRSIEDYNNIKVGDPINLAVGVEAGIQVTTSNIDEGSLTYEAQIGEYDSALKEYTPNDLIKDIISVNYQYDKYILRFDTTRYEDFESLIGKQIRVTFTASKTLNTIVETCQATMVFDIQKLVIHSVSLEHNTSNNTMIYGNYDEQFSIQYYFSPTDVSYYNPVTKTYWNTMYTLANTQNAGTGTPLDKMNEILTILNSSSAYIKFAVSSNSVPGDINYTSGDKAQNNRIEISQSGSTINIYAQSGSNINDAQLQINFKVNYNPAGYPSISTDGNAIEISKKYGFMIGNKTNPFEGYEKVETEQQFLSMQEGKHYQLMNNLTFDKYLPFNTNIAAFNGNGNTITINSFDMEGLSQLYPNGVANVGLFGTVNVNTVIQNLQVNYPTQTISLAGHTLLNGENYTELYFGGIAGVNLGVITNVNVYGNVEIKAPQIVPELIHIGGITGSNGKLSEGESTTTTLLATITNSTVSLTIEGLGLIGGITDVNLGKIANTIFNGTVNCNNSQGYEYVGLIYTAGFVVNNYGGIYLSGSVGGRLSSVGSTGGLVAINHSQGVIENCYVNKVSISAQGRIGGFVYENNGTINKSYAYASIPNSLFYASFISVVGAGSLTDCYAVVNVYEISKIDGLTNIAVENINKKEQYSNFVFASNSFGVWEMSSTGPELANAGYTTRLDIFNIYDVETYQGFFERNKANDNVVRNHFRIVRDIDLSILTTNPITSQIIFEGSIEGNGLTISGYNLYNDNTSLMPNETSIGLFASIKQNASQVFIRNLVLQPGSVRASGINVVGGLAGIIDGAYVYNVKIDNNTLLIIGKNAVGGLAGIIKGDFEVIGIFSNVSVFSAYRAGESSGQYNIYTGKHVLGTTASDNIKQVSYAGSVAGIINGYGSYSFDTSKRNISNYFVISNITIEGDLTLSAETVGGVAGLVGESTMLSNVTYYLTEQTAYKGIFSAGGLVGENRGIIQNANILTATDTNPQENFNKGARINGGIVGINLGGFVYNSNSYVNVYSSQALSTAGGIVGRNISGYIQNCGMYGDVDAEFVGGIAGVDYSYQLMSNQNRYATPTSSSRIVYTTTLNNGYITYNGVNLDGGTGVAERYYDNIVGKSYIDRFIAKASNYYDFNINYGDEDNNLIIAKRVYGLFIGITDNAFGIDVTLSNGNIKVTLGAENTTIYDVELYGNDYEISAIKNIIINGYNTQLLYLIGYQGTTYDYWTSTLGYSNKLVLLSGRELDVATPAE